MKCHAGSPFFYTQMLIHHLCDHLCLTAPRLKKVQQRRPRIALRVFRTRTVKDNNGATFTPRTSCVKGPYV